MMDEKTGVHIPWPALVVVGFAALVVLVLASKPGSAFVAEFVLGCLSLWAL